MFSPLKGQTKGPLESLREKTAKAIVHAMPGKANDAGEVNLIDSKVIPLLERIERNTRRGTIATAKNSSGLGRNNEKVAPVTTAQKAPLPPTHERGSRIPGKAASSPARAGRKASLPVADDRRGRKNPSAGAADTTPPTPALARDIAGAVTRATRGSQEQKRSASGRFVGGEAGSVRALREAKASDAEKASRKGLEDILDNTSERDSGKSWGKEHSGEATDAAGSAVGGPIWGAMMEMKEFAGKVNEDRQDADPGSIRSILSQKIQDKTGVTAVKGKLAGARDAIHGKVLGMVGGKKEEAAPATKAKPVPVKFDAPPSQGGGDSGGGIMSLLGDFAGKGLGKLGGKVGGRFGKVLSGAGMLLGGESALGAAGTAASAATGAGAAAGGAAKAGGGMLGKVMGGGAKFLGRAAGPIAALAMNLPDLVSGISEGDSKKTGGAVGGIGGSLAGGMAGAAIGTAILPGVGTLIGGAIGAFAGDFLGGKAGKAIGGTMFGGVKDSVDGLAESVDGNSKSLDKKDDSPPATGVNWGGGGLVDMLSSAGTSVKRFFTGEKVDPIAGSNELGSLSAKYESGGRGSEAIGYDAKGGTSYGKYQIASKTGTMDKFMEYAKTANPDVYNQLQAAGPADGGKDGGRAKKWQELAQSGQLGTMEHDFIKKTHFDPAYQGIQDSGLRDQISGSKTMQDVLMSTAVQHGPSQTGGGAADIFNKVYKPGMSQEDLTKGIYEERKKRFGGSSAAVQASVANRLTDEQGQAQARLTAEKSGTPTLAANAPTSSAPMYVPPKGSRPGGTRSGPALEQQVAAVTPTATIAAPAQIASVPVAQAPQSAQVATLATPQPAIRGVNSLVEEESSAPMKMPTIPGMDTSKIEGLLSLLVKASEKVADKVDKDTKKDDTPTIPMEFDDTALALMAHDRM